MPKRGVLPRSVLIVSIAYVTGAGSPGPFERNTPSGLSDRISSALVAAGTTVTRQPESTRHRRMLRFNPRSIATTCRVGGCAGLVAHAPIDSLNTYGSF